MFPLCGVTRKSGEVTSTQASGTTLNNSAKVRRLCMCVYLCVCLCVGFSVSIDRIVFTMCPGKSHMTHFRSRCRFLIKTAGFYQYGLVFRLDVESVYVSKEVWACMHVLNLAKLAFSFPALSHTLSWSQIWTLSDPL